MRRIDEKQEVEVYDFLKQIRKQRNYLVQQEVSWFVNESVCTVLYRLSNFKNVKNTDGGVFKVFHAF